MTEESDARQVTNDRQRIQRRLAAIGLAVVAILVLTTVVAVPVFRSRSVAFYFGRTPVPQTFVAAMVADLPFDPTSSYYKTRVELLDRTSSKAEYIIAGLNKEAVERLVVMYAQASEAAKLGITISASELEKAVKTYINEHALPDDADEIARLESTEMRSYIALREISAVYENRCTKDTTVTSKEVSDYFAAWSWRYMSSNGVQLTFAEAHEQATRDALANKKFQQILLDRSQLLSVALTEVKGDTRYKQFMRWWNIMFGTEVPDNLQPLQIEPVS